MTIATAIITFFSVIGACVAMYFLIDTISKAVSKSQEYKKKRIDNLEKINDKLDDIIRILHR